MSKELHEAVADALFFYFKDGVDPTRGQILWWIKLNRRELNTPRLQLDVSKILETSVRLGKLKRVGQGTRYYKPGEKLLAIVREEK